MSVAIMGAVFKCGPTEMAAKMVLLSIADNADDFGFAFPSIGTLAGKASCDERTVQRQIEALEAGGWIKIERKAIQGRGNAYFIDIGKIGVSVSPMARVSDLHSMVLRLIRDRMSSIDSAREGVRKAPATFAAPENTDDTDTFSDDNPQGSQTTFEAATPAQCHLTDDKLCRPNHHLTTRTNHQGTINETEPNPPTPLLGVSFDPGSPHPWSRFLVALKADLWSTPATFPGGRSLPEIVPGQNDYESCFRDWWLHATTVSGSLWELVTVATRPEMTRKGITKYRKRLEGLLREAFSVPTHFAVRFEVRDAADAHHAA